MTFNRQGFECFTIFMDKLFKMQTKCHAFVRTVFVVTDTTWRYFAMLSDATCLCMIEVFFHILVGFNL